MNVYLLKLLAYHHVMSTNINPYIIFITHAHVFSKLYLLTSIKAYFIYHTCNILNIDYAFEINSCCLCLFSQMFGKTFHCTMLGVQTVLFMKYGFSLSVILHHYDVIIMMSLLRCYNSETKIQLCCNFLCCKATQFECFETF